MFVYFKVNTKSIYIPFLLVFSLLLLITDYGIFKTYELEVDDGFANGKDAMIAGGYVPDGAATGLCTGGNLCTFIGDYVPDGAANALIANNAEFGSAGGSHDINGQCINIYLPSQLGSGINCLRLYESVHVQNSLNPTVMLKTFNGGWCSIGDYPVKDIRGQNYCLESDK